MNQFFEHIKTFVILFLIGVIIVLTQCNNPPTTDKVEIKTDTIVKTKIDTLRFVDTVTVSHTITKFDTVKVLEEDTTDFRLSLREYSKTYEDSLIKADFRSEVKGYLMNIHFNYKPKFPKYITKVDSVIINKNKKVAIPPRLSIYAGLSGGFKRVSPELQLNTGNGWSYTVGYNIINYSENSKLKPVEFGIKKRIVYF